MSEHLADSKKLVVVVGTSHRRADVALRERLHVAPETAGAVARELADAGCEAVVLSTCNRTEIYLSAAGDEHAVSRARAALAERAGVADGELPLFEYDDDAAALHLFRVAAGLDSVVLGETQILGQIRDAYAAARAAGSTGPALNRLFAQALHTGRKVRSQTALSELASSVPAAAAELAARVLGDLRGRRILVIGAGKMGELTAKHFAGRGVALVSVANHTIGRAEELARRVGGEAGGFERIGAELERADVVVSSTRCPRYVLTADDVAPALRRRGGRPLLLIDIAVPRDLDPAIGRLEGASLYDIDHLGAALGEELAPRRDEILEADALIGQEVDSFRAWRLSLDVVPAIAALRRRAEEIRADELARSEARLRTLSPREREVVDVVTAQIVNKLLHSPTVRIKEAAADADGAAYAVALRHLFALDEQSA